MPSSSFLPLWRRHCALRESPGHSEKGRCRLPPRLTHASLQEPFWAVRLAQRVAKCTWYTSSRLGAGTTACPAPSCLAEKVIEQIFQCQRCRRGTSCERLDATGSKSKTSFPCSDAILISDTRNTDCGRLSSFEIQD
jgi:hypothetical protein